MLTALVRARGLLAALPLLIVTVLIASVLNTAPASAAARTKRIGDGFQITSHQRGDRYDYGAAGPNRFDCSGLVYYSYRKAGFRHVPRTSSGQARHMKRIKKSHLRRGDFVFFHRGAARPGNVYHVGVYAGFHHGRRVIIHAPRPGQRVQRDPIWTRSWFAGTLRGL